MGVLDEVGFGEQGTPELLGVGVFVGLTVRVGVGSKLDVGVTGILQGSKLDVGELVIDGVGVWLLVRDIVGVFVCVGTGGLK